MRIFGQGAYWDEPRDPDDGDGVESYQHPLVPTALTVSIYALVDPISEEVRYVGRTQDLAIRRRQHLADHTDTPKTRWIEELAARGREPGIVELTRCTREDADYIESRFIADYIAAGHRLTNREAPTSELANLKARVQILEAELTTR